MSDDPRIAELVAELAQLRRERDAALGAMQERAREIAREAIASAEARAAEAERQAMAAAEAERRMQAKFAALVEPVDADDGISLRRVYVCDADNSTHADLRGARIAAAAARWRQRGMRDPRDAKIAAEAEVDRDYPPG